MSAPRPYPWQSLETVPRETLASARLAREALDGCGGRRSLEAALGDLFAQPCALTLARIAPLGLVRIRPSVACLLRLRNDTARVLIVAEAQLAARIAALASGRPCPLVDPLRPAPNSVQGAFAAFVIAVARRAARVDPPVLVAAGPAAFEAWRPSPRVIACEAVLHLEQQAFAFSALVDPSLRPTLAPPFDRNRLRALGSTQLSLVLDAGMAVLDESLIASVRPGDVVVAGDGWRVSRASDGLVGDVLLRSSRSTTGLPAKLIAGGRIVLGEGTMTADADIPNDAEAEPSEAAAQVIGEAPVLVRIEIGQVSMTARQWASVAPGDVLETGVRVADKVVLRIAGREVARGELVEVEGELGVRITQVARRDDGGTT